MYPVNGWADYPFWYGAGGPRVRNMALMSLLAKRWVQANFPYWDRRGGADHIFLYSHDEGACWAPNEVTNSSIILTHWGRTDRLPERCVWLGWWCLLCARVCVCVFACRQRGHARAPPQRKAHTRHKHAR